jgi:hypothetical protein
MVIVPHTSGSLKPMSDFRAKAFMKDKELCKKYLKISIKRTAALKCKKGGVT